MEKLKDFTPSHISAVCLGIYEALEFEDIEKLGVDGVQNIIDTEIANCLVPITDMKARENAMKKWRENLGSTPSTI